MGLRRPESFPGPIGGEDPGAVPRDAAIFVPAAHIPRLNQVKQSLAIIDVAVCQVQLINDQALLRQEENIPKPIHTVDEVKPFVFGHGIQLCLGQPRRPKPDQYMGLVAALNPPHQVWKISVAKG